MANFAGDDFVAGKFAVADREIVDLHRHLDERAGIFQDHGKTADLLRVLRCVHVPQLQRVAVHFLSGKPRLIWIFANPIVNLSSNLVDAADRDAVQDAVWRGVGQRADVALVLFPGIQHNRSDGL